MRTLKSNVSTLTAAGLLLSLFLVFACSRVGSPPSPVVPTPEPKVEGTPVALPSPEVRQFSSRAEDELRAVFGRLLKQSSVQVKSHFRKTTYLPMKRDGVASPSPLVFVYGPVESRGSFIPPGSFDLTQTVEPPLILPFDSSQVTVEGTEWVVTVTDGVIVSAATTGLASVLPPYAGPEDLLAQFLAVSLTGGAFGGGLDEFLAFESVDFVRPQWDEGTETVIEARRKAVNGGDEIWRFAVAYGGHLRRISFATRPPLVSIVSGRLQPAPEHAAVLEVVAPLIVVPTPQPTPGIW